MEERTGSAAKTNGALFNGHVLPEPNASPAISHLRQKTFLPPENIKHAVPVSLFSVNPFH
jgi:hypothetical protein